jgi:hypothetical protein
MSEVDLSGVLWRKSTGSSGDSQCVEVAALKGATAVRDSTDPAGPALTFTPAEWPRSLPEYVQATSTDRVSPAVSLRCPQGAW